MKGFIKINNITFDPQVHFYNGTVLWGGTKREEKGFGVYRLDKKDNTLAFELINREIEFITYENRFGETLAKIIRE